MTALILPTNENKLKLSKYLCRSFDNRWSSSRTWDDIPEDTRKEWFIEACNLITALNDQSPDWKDPFWPINK